MAATRCRCGRPSAWMAALLAYLSFVSLALAATLPTAATVRASIARYLVKPLPSVESIVGIPMPPASPMVVVASFGDDGMAPGLDRGYAVGRTLNEVLFGAHESLDVEAMPYYILDVSAPNVAAGLARDSRANAYRVATREAAAWCAYGRVEGNVPSARVVVVVGRLQVGPAQRAGLCRRRDSEWPRVVADACDYIVATAVGVSARSRAACDRARAIRSESFLAYAAFATTRGMPFERLQALVAADPRFAPAVVDLIYRLPAKQRQGGVPQGGRGPSGRRRFPALPLRSLPCHGKHPPTPGSSSIARCPPLRPTSAPIPRCARPGCCTRRRCRAPSCHDYPWEPPRRRTRKTTPPTAAATRATKRRTAPGLRCPSPITRTARSPTAPAGRWVMRSCVTA
jgi:hypothetical protein